MSTTTTTSSSAGAKALQDQQYVNWVFTIQYGGPNQPGEDDAVQMIANLMPKAGYVVYGYEVAPTTGQKHLQGYVQLKKKERRTALVKMIPCFWDPAREDDQTNFDYVTKDGVWVEEGERKTTNPGKREQERYALARDNAKAGKWEDIHPQIFVTCYGQLRSIHKDFMKIPEDLDSVCGVWICGEAGVGKSYKAREDYPNAYFKLCNKWWDGYDNQDNVIIDDVDKNHHMLGHQFKLWADRYAFVAEIKGSALTIRPKKLIVTSQYHPDEIWDDRETRDAIKRRFKIIRMGAPADAPALMRETFVKPREDSPRPNKRKLVITDSQETQVVEATPQPSSKKKREVIEIVDTEDEEDSEDGNEIWENVTRSRNVSAPKRPSKMTPVRRG